MSLLDGLVSWWDLEEASGTRADAHGDHDLTDNNTVGSGAGRVGVAADAIETNNEYLAVNAPVDFTDSHSVAFWVYRRAGSTVTGIGNASGMGWRIRTSILEARNSLGTVQNIALPETFTNNTWHFFVVSYDAATGTLSARMNGSETASTLALTGGIQAPSPNQLSMFFGMGAGSAGGLIDSYGLWNRVLSNAEVLALYNGGAGRSYADLAGGGGEYTLTAEAGTFAAAGQTATLRAARRMAADVGTFALTGQSATLSAGQVIAAETGTLTLTGQSAGLRAARHLTAEQGTFTATGQTSDLLRTYRIAADPGTLAATGQAAALVYTPASGAYTLAAEAGAFTATGQDAALTAARRIAATTGTYALTGQTATLAHGLTLTAEPGTLALAGQAATLTRTRIMAAETGAFTLSGQTAALTWSGRPVPTVPAERTYVVPFESRTFAVPYENRTLTA